MEPVSQPKRLRSLGLRDVRAAGVILRPMTIQGAAEGATYSEAVAGMEEFGIALKGLLREMLSHHGVDVHTIDHRVKEERSAKLKIDSSDGVYSGFSELHDLLGLRITCYFADEVNLIAGIIDREFDPDPTKSEDKGSKLGLQEFGYRSVHRVAGLGGQPDGPRRVRPLQGTAF